MTLKTDKNLISLNALRTNSEFTRTADCSEPDRAHFYSNIHCFKIVML